MDTSAKARLISLTIRIQICIRITDPDCHQNLIICSLAYYQPFLKISCKSVQTLLHKVANKQTDKQRRKHNLLRGGKKPHFRDMKVQKFEYDNFIFQYVNAHWLLYRCQWRQLGDLKVSWPKEMKKWKISDHKMHHSIYISSSINVPTIRSKKHPSTSLIWHILMLPLLTAYGWRHTEVIVSIKYTSHTYWIWCSHGVRGCCRYIGWDSSDSNTSSHSRTTGSTNYCDTATYNTVTHN